MSAVHYTDFVGRTHLLGLRSKYLVGRNEPTGGVKDKWFLYSHSSYFGEVPDEFLKNPDGSDKFDNNRNRVGNPEYKNYVRYWGVPEKDSNGN